MELKTTKDFENYAKSIISSGEGYLRDLYSVCCRWNIIGKFTHDITFARKCFYDGEKIMRLNFCGDRWIKAKDNKNGYSSAHPGPEYKVFTTEAEAKECVATYKEKHLEEWRDGLKKGIKNYSTAVKEYLSFIKKNIAAKDALVEELMEVEKKIASKH